MTRDEWIEAFAREAGVSRPSAEQIDELLRLAGVAAHASERTSAPLTTWIAGRSARSLAELGRAADRIADVDQSRPGGSRASEASRPDAPRASHER